MVYGLKRSFLLTGCALAAVTAVSNATVTRTFANTGSICSPLRAGLGSTGDDAMTDTKASHRRLIERYREGGYRVTRCNQQGRPKASTTYREIEVADGGYALAPVESVKIDRGRVRIMRSLYSTIDGDDSRKLRRAHARRTRTLGFRYQSNSAHVARKQIGEPLEGGLECFDTASNLTGAKWPARQYNYRVNRSTIPGYLGASSTADEIVSAHFAWNNTVNNCVLYDQNNFMMSYDGDTSAPFGPDFINNVVFGNPSSIGCPSSAVECVTWWVYPDTPSVITEADILLNWNDVWSLSSTRRDVTYDVRSYVAHSAGITIGVDDVPVGPWLTMSSVNSCTGCTNWRTLGNGDILGMRTLYPG